ncbi:MAG: YtxH domain-containing protein [Muribaculaceae bacterium]|jgi:gas vesicle protein|nr:YtxH domain-containing protein [Muribaculaceae bacterium]
MNNLSLFYAFLGGALIGGAAAVMFAPAKGSELRRKIKDTLQKKGIICTQSEIDALVEQLTADID